MICIQLDNKFDWLGLACGLVYPVIVACGRNRENRVNDEEYDQDCVKKGFQLARGKFDRNGK